MAVFKTKTKTKDGRQWVFKVYYKDLTGKTKQKISKQYITKKEAQEAEMIFVMSMTDKINNNDLYFSEVFNSYYNFQKDKIKYTSLLSVKKLYQHLKLFDNLLLKDISIKHFNQWKEQINKTDLSTSYKNSIYKSLKAIFHYASKHLNIENNNINKFTNFTNPNELKKEMLFYTLEEFYKFISVETDLTYITFFKTLYYCGLRQGEAQALQWKDIDLIENQISVTKSLTTKIKGERYRITTPKTKSSVRMLPIPKTLLNDLKTLLKVKEKIYNFNEDFFVFGDVFPLATTTIQNKKNANCKLAKVKQIRIHDFRHSCASLLINKGATITLIAKYLGHSNVATTLNVYSHMFKNELKEIVNMLNEL